MPDNVDELTDAISELAALVVDELDLQSLLQRVAELAAQAIPGCDSAGVTLLVEGRPQTAAATDGRTLQVDEAQYAAGDGPCLEAYRTTKVLRIVAEEAHERYPEFAGAAANAGVRSFLAAPLTVSDTGVGALNLYSSERHGFADLDEAVVLLFAGQAAVAVRNSHLYEGARRLTGQLEEAMASRAVIEQAKGVLMATYSIDADQAFDKLRRSSQLENRKLRVLAADVVSAAVAGRPVLLRDENGRAPAGRPRGGSA